MLPQNPGSVRLFGPVATVAGVAVLCLGLQAMGWTDPLRYERDLIVQGQSWRLLTGHFVHLGWRHWWLNVAGLALIVALFVESMRPARVTACMLFSALVVGAGLFVLSPAVGWYVGLSGALHGLFVVGLLAHWRTQPGLSWLILALFVGKLAYECLHGPLPGSEATAGGPVVVAAHSYGAVGGVLFWGSETGLRYAAARVKGEG